MLASIPASILNQRPDDLGIPNRFTLKSSRSSVSEVEPYEVSFRGEAEGREPGIHNPGPWSWIPGSPLRSAPE
jgi:hypothetical protein